MKTTSKFGLIGSFGMFQRHEGGHHLQARGRIKQGNSNTATANAARVVVGVNAGLTAVTAEFQGATGSVNCTVGL